MRKLLAIFLILLFVFALHKIAITFASVPPTSKTGAPGEETCFTSGCHLLGILNPPNAGIEIMFNNGTNSYVPDSVYVVSVTVTDSVMKIFGFELTALDSNDLRVGAFVILDSSNTYALMATGREYITHFLATDPINVGAGFFTWQFEWIAPAVNAGPITFYTAGVAATSPISAPAGNVHTTTLSVFQDSIVGISDNAEDEYSFSVFPNPADQYIRFLFKNGATKLNQATLYSIDGKSSFRYSGGRFNSNVIDVSDVPAGLYLIRVDDSLSKKLFISH